MSPVLKWMHSCLSQLGVLHWYPLSGGQSYCSAPPSAQEGPLQGRISQPRISVQFTSVAQSRLTLCDPMAHPLSPTSPPAFNLSQHQGLFKWVSSLHQVAKVLEFPASASVLPMNIQDWFPLGWAGWISLQFKGLKSLLQHHSSKASPQLKIPLGYLNSQNMLHNLSACILMEYTSNGDWD